MFWVCVYLTAVLRLTENTAQSEAQLTLTIHFIIYLSYNVTDKKHICKYIIYVFLS